MAINQIYGPNYWAGVPITASGKYQGTTGTTTVAVAQVVTLVDQNGVAQGSATSSSRIPSAAATTNATLAKNAAGKLFMVSGYNASAAVRYVKIYNKASAPTVGTDTPILTLAVPPTAAFAFDIGGLYFATGIAYALTTGAADADTGALTLADIVGLNVVYA